MVGLKCVLVQAGGALLCSLLYALRDPEVDDLLLVPLQMDFVELLNDLGGCHFRVEQAGGGLPITHCVVGLQILHDLHPCHVLEVAEVEVEVGDPILKYYSLVRQHADPVLRETLMQVLKPFLRLRPLLYLILPGVRLVELDLVV